MRNARVTRSAVANCAHTNVESTGERAYTQGLPSGYREGWDARATGGVAEKYRCKDCGSVCYVLRNNGYRDEGRWVAG